MANAEGTRDRGRYIVVRQPTPVLDTGVREERARFGWISHAMNECPEAQRLHGLDEELAQLRGSPVVAPVADPDEIVRALLRARIEDANIGRLVPDPRVLRPLTLQIDVANGPAEGEHAVVVAQVVRGHALRLGDGAVMGVVK